MLQGVKSALSQVPGQRQQSGLSTGVPKVGIANVVDLILALGKWSRISDSHQEPFFCFVLLRRYLPMVFFFTAICLLYSPFTPGHWMDIIPCSTDVHLCMRVLQPRPSHRRPGSPATQGMTGPEHLLGHSRW